MNSTATAREIWIKTTKTGRRAFTFSYAAGRVVPVRLVQAEMEIATGQAVEIAGKFGGCV